MGLVLASIAGPNWTNSNIPTSITFSGDNRNYEDTLYLHPSINSIIFSSKDSIINNINFPQSEDESRREVHLISKNSTNNVNTLTISDSLLTNM